MLALVRTELLKLVTTRGPWMLAAASLAVTIALAVQPVLNAGRGGSPSIGTVGALLEVLEAMGRGSLLALVVGVLVMTAEFHHQTVTSTLLLVPRRRHLLAAKGLAAAMVGLALGAAALAGVLAVGAASGALQPELVNPDIAWRAGGLVLTYPAYAVLGVGVGALLPNSQPVAVLLPVVWLLGLEALALGRLGQSVLAWSLTGATDALQNAGNVPGVLPVWLGSAALLVYLAAALLGGGWRLARRDVT